VKFTSKKTADNYFVLYDSNEEIVCYFNDFKELSKYINYKYKRLIQEFNNSNSNIIKVNIDEKKYKLAIFC